jgi:hypothetical protein
LPPIHIFLVSTMADSFRYLDDAVALAIDAENLLIIGR